MRCSQCISYAKGGRCTNGKHHGELVGYFDKACHLFKPIDNSIQEAMDNSINTPMKVCSDCGRELPIDSFAHHARTLDGHQPICRECMRSRLKGRRKTPEVPKAATPPSVDEILDGLIPNTSTSAPGKAVPKYVQTRSTEDLDDIEIIDELRRRGWTGEIYKKYQL